MSRKLPVLFSGTVLVVSQLILGVGLAEIVLRVLPSLVTPAFLTRFPNALKVEVARKIGLPTESEYVRISSDERSDKGLDIFLSKPHATYFRPADAADAAAGAMDLLTADGLGFCNPAAQSTTDANIVVIGGSLPNCAGVTAENNFTEQLEALTGKSTYNLAVGGTGPFDFVEMLKRYGLAMKPQVVVMAYSEANELRDCGRHFDHLAGNSRVAKQDREWGFPFSVSYALSFFKAGIEVAVRQARAIFADDFTYTVKVQGKSVNLNIRNGDRDELESARDMAAGKLSPALCEPALADFARLGKEYGFTPVVMLAPAAYTVYQNTIAFGDPQLNALMKNYSDQQRKWLSGNASRIGFVYSDPVIALQNAAPDLPLLYFPSNAHLTPKGHEALAKAFFRLPARVP